MDPSDTSREAQAAQRAVWERLGPGGRLELAVQMSEEIRELAIAGLMARCPHLSRREALLVLVRRTLGDALFHEAFGDRTHGA